MKFNEFIAQAALPKLQNLGNDTGNSWHKDWPDVTAADMTDWEEFNEQTFEYLYSYIWKSSVDCPSLRKPPNQMTYVTAEDSIENLLAAIFQLSIGQLFENLKSTLGREIWLGAGSLCDLGSNVSLSNSPDWTCTALQNGNLIRRVCHCPGDTKSGNKFYPDLIWNGTAQEKKDNLPPFRQGAHYARLAKSRYAFIVNEREIVVMRVSFEDTNSRPQSRRAVPQRTAAPLPGTQRLSGHSGVSEAFSSMSLDSFAPEDASGVEMAVFPWATKRRGLTGFGAWIMLLIIATEPEEHGTGRSHAPLYSPLHTMIVKEKPAEVKKGKIVCPAKKTYTSILNGKKYGFAPKFVNLVDSNSRETDNTGSEEDDYYDE